MRFGVLLCCTTLGCRGPSCESPAVSAAETVSGVSPDELQVALSEQPFSPIPIRWWDGAETSAAVTWNPKEESARTTQVSDGDCSEACCGSDRLTVTGSVVLTTPDPRLLAATWTGDLQASRDQGALVWVVVSGPTLVFGSLDLRDAAGLQPAEDVEGLRISLAGREGTLEDVGFSVSWSSRDALGSTAIGGSLRAGDTGW